MPLTPGRRLGPYEILAAIGAGGMGEVYRAKDTRLDRIVAIKVLPTHLSDNPQLKQRFEREARTISSLSHQHICALHDIGSQDGIDYLVMEYIEGDSLARRLDKGALPTEQVLRLGVQIAEALDKAHRQGIVHRDLKPANIMITRSGIKLLDFGLAKLGEVKSSETSASELLTRDRPLTEEGTVLGTVQYMSPEQLEGKEADARTDIFAFGEVLYEMATGRKAFQGTSKASLISAILATEPPPVSAVQPLAPLALDHVIRKCLAKDAEDRWQSAQDVASELKWISESTSQPKAAAGPTHRRKIHYARILAAVFFLTTFASLFVLYRFIKTGGHRDVLKLSILPEAQTSVSQAGSLAISPNGRFLAFVAITKDGNNSLWIRPLDSLQGRRLAGTDDAAYPFWSPDGAFIGFFAQGKLKKIDIVGGPPQTLCDVTSGRGASWSKDGVILFSPNLGTGLFKVSASGGSVTPVTTLNASLPESTHRWPYFLPDGNHFLYVIHSVKPENSGIFVGSLDGKTKKRILPDESHTEYADPGYLVFVRNTTLTLQPFDLSAMQVTGEALPVGEIYFESGAGIGSYSVSQSGVLSYAATSGYGSQQFVWVDRQGKVLGKLGEPGVNGDAWFSPDEKRIVLYSFHLSAAQKPDIWIVELEQGTFTRFTFDPANDFQPIWSPDGTQIAFSSNRTGSYNLYVKSLGGSGEEKVLVDSKEWKFGNDWTRDGRYLIYENDSDRTKADLWVYPFFGDRKPFVFLQTEFNETHAQVSPDGKWIAYASDETGRPEVYVQSFPVLGGKRQISTSGGDQPSWRRDQKELFYLAPDGRLTSVDVRAGQTFEAGMATALFETRVPSIPLVGNDRNQYLATSDGQRFLVNRVALEDVTTPITLIFNWPKMMKK